MRQQWNENWIFKKDNTEIKQEIILPHDAMIHEKRSDKAIAGSASGYYPGGIYYYEKTFYIDKELLDKYITVEFEGVYKNAEIFMNEKKIYTAGYGYCPFFVELDGHIREGKNTITVKVDNNKQPDSRWYSGAGIYRPVWLHIQHRDHILLEGIKIHTKSIDPAIITVDVEKTGGTAVIDILDKEGRRVAAGKAEENIEIKDAVLWSDKNPYLYTVKVTLISDDGKKLDEVEKKYGIRKLTWDNTGFYVNGINTLLRGGCIHHDNGVIGACEFEESADRKIRILKENGYNAIRSAHNPCSDAILNACDKYGMYVIDEMWDMWYNHKNEYDYATEFMKNCMDDIYAIVRRDFNHPSVVMYSIGNEVSEPATEKGIKTANELADVIRKMDSDRPVTCGVNLMIIKSAAGGKGIYKEEGGRDDKNEKKMSQMNSTMFNLITSMVGSGMNKAANGAKADKLTSPVFNTLDICGYNYASGRYKTDGKLHPERIIFGSETFPQDISKNWKMVERYPYLIGDFMWTAWDYIGEAGLGSWSCHEDAKRFNKPYPWLLADTGAFDILGNPNGEAMLAKTVWGFAKEPLIGVRPCNQPNRKLIKASWRGTNSIPSWSWCDCDGNDVTVEVFTDAVKVELFINAVSKGVKKVKDYRAVFKTKYAPGIIRAVAYDKRGKITGISTMCSAEGELSVHINPEKKAVSEGEIVYIDISVGDNNGIIEANCDVKIKLLVEGGKLLGFGSANPRTEERFDDGECTTYYGRAMAVVRVEEAEKLIVRADTEEFGRSECVIEKVKAAVGEGDGEVL